MFALVLAVEAGPSSAGDENCDIPGNSPGFCPELKVTKVVTGTVPPGTTFPVVVDCQSLTTTGEAQAAGLPPANQVPFTTTLTFPEDGGMQSILLVPVPIECTITETPPAGCTLVSIEPSSLEIGPPRVYPVTVTNDCELAAAPAAAEAVEAAPTFTG